MNWRTDTLTPATLAANLKKSVAADESLTSTQQQDLATPTSGPAPTLTLRF